MPTSSGGSWTRPLVAFFRRHPVLLFLALTPGIPEYLSGSSSVAFVLFFPGGTFVFFLFLALNLGLYGPGVLLVREAWVRWGRGWGALLLLGAAYGLLEEGTALSTLFDPHASVVGGLGHYGRFVGVNWVWLVGVLGVHIVLSVGLPILLLGLALPETRGRSLLTPRALRWALPIYVADLVVLALIANYWREQLAWLLAAALVAILLVYAASRLPHGWLHPPRPRPTVAPRTCFLLGLAYFPVLLLVPAFGSDAHLPALVTGAVDLLAAALLFEALRRGVGRSGNEAHLALLAFGATLPIAAFGLLAQLRLPLVLLVDVVYLAFFLALRRRYRPVDGAVAPATAAPPAP
jgi:hypothetical protein